MAVLELFRNYLGSGGVCFNVVVVPRLAVQDKHGDEQTDQHGNANTPVGGGNVLDRYRKTVFTQIIRDNALENQSETKRNGDIRRFMAERQRTRNGTPVKPHTVHHAEQRRHENRDIRDMHRNEVLRQAGNERQHTDERQLVSAEQA